MGLEQAARSVHPLNSVGFAPISDAELSRGGIARSVIVGTVETLREPVVSAAQHIGLMETTRRIAERGLLAAMKLLEVQINLLRLIRISSEVVRRVWMARAHGQYRAPNFFGKAVDALGSSTEGL